MTRHHSIPGLSQADALHVSGDLVADKLNLQAAEAMKKGDMANGVLLLRRAAGLGHGMAAYNLGVLHHQGSDGVRRSAPEAAKWYRIACDKDCSPAFLNLAQMHFRKEIPDSREDEGWRLLRRGAELGDVGAQFGLGRRLWNENEGGDAVESLRWISAAAEQDFGRALIIKGAMLIDGVGCAPDPEGAVACFRRAAELGISGVDAALRLAEERIRNGPPIILEEVEAKAEAGDVASIFLLGQCHERGVKGEPDHSKAADYYEIAIRHGHREAKTNLAYLLKRGLGRPEDERAAHELYEQAAREGDHVAQAQMGRLREEARDRKGAIHWYDMAQKAGNKEVGEHLEALRAMEELGIPSDAEDPLVTLHFMMLKSEAEAGNMDSASKLGRMYEAGEGTEADPKQALFWYEKGLEAGNAEAAFRLSMLLLGGAPEEMQDHQRGFDMLVKSAEAGHAEAQYHCGEMYEHHVRRTGFLSFFARSSKSEAVEWYRKAAAQGHPEARGALARLGKG
jgi:TPR repeat protein